MFTKIIQIYNMAILMKCFLMCVGQHEIFNKNYKGEHGETCEYEVAFETVMETRQ